MDPISAFAAAQTALGLIRKGVDFYKECKATSSDVSQITTEVTGYIGRFLDAKTVVQEAAQKAKQESEDPENAGDLNSQALNNVMLQMQLEAAEKELREMLIYESPGLGAIWTKFEKERERLNQLRQKQREAAETRRQEELQESRLRAAKRKAKIRELWEEAHWIALVLSLVIFYGGSMYLIWQDRMVQNPELGTCFIPKGSPGYKTWSNLRWVDCEN
jgi:hypothetical protein